MTIKIDCPPFFFFHNINTMEILSIIPDMMAMDTIIIDTTTAIVIGLIIGCCICCCCSRGGTKVIHIVQRV